ncbi:hypothetical protein QT970_04110 [Microcoleus sp. herbarium8]|uniref:hypothetical protein n=1 Tax=Microcoleus sp. herbarium8 TaxID=3055436 RepID=UPI002FCF6D6A
MVQVCLLLSISANVRSGGLFLLRSGDLILADRVMRREEACGSFHSNINFKLMCFEKGDRYF